MAQLPVPSILLCVAVAMAMAYAQEYLSWYLTLRRGDFAEAVADIHERKGRLDAELEKQQKKGKVTPTLDAQLNQLTDRCQALAQRMAKYQIITGLGGLGLTVLLLRQFKGAVALRLPWALPGLLRRILQQGLEEAGPGDVSVVCLVFLATLPCRSAAKGMFPQVEGCEPMEVKRRYKELIDALKKRVSDKSTN